MMKNTRNDKHDKANYKEMQKNEPHGRCKIENYEQYNKMTK